MSIQVGDKLASLTLFTPEDGKPQAITTDSVFTNKKVVLFAVPGAFTPTCSNAHLPGFVVHYDAIKAKGVDTVACLAVNDAFVMDAWAKSQNAENILMLADGNAEFTKACGLLLDARAHGMGERSKRFAMIIENGVISHLAIDEKGLEATSAEAILAVL